MTCSQIRTLRFKGKGVGYIWSDYKKRSWIKVPEKSKIKIANNVTINNFLALFTLTPPSPPKDHLLPQEALSRLIVIFQLLSLAEAMPLAHIQPV